MKTQSPALAAEKRKMAVTYVYFVKIGTYCFGSSTHLIVFKGDHYEPYPMKLDDFLASDGSPLDGGEIRIGAYPLPPSA